MSARRSNEWHGVPSDCLPGFRQYESVSQIDAGKLITTVQYSRILIKIRYRHGCTHLALVHVAGRLVKVREWNEVRENA